jgi:uncharacterized membrane protein
MPIRPIDMSITVQRTADLNRAQTGQQAPPETQHQQFADRLNRMAEQEQTQVNQSPTSEEATVNKDGKGGNQAGGKRGKKKKKEDETPTKSRMVSNSMFDVTI